MEITVRWRERHELFIRLKRDALFFDVQWNELASAVLQRFSSDTEQKRKDAVPGPVEDMPSQKYPRFKDLPLLSRAWCLFYTNQLKLLKEATSMKERMLIAEEEFVKDDWLMMVSQGMTCERGAPFKVRRSPLIAQARKTN